MVKLLKEFQEFIDKNSKNYNIEIEVKSWQECVTNDGDGTSYKPIFTIKLKERE